MSTVFKISYKPPPPEVLNQLIQLPPIPLPISPPNLTITRRLIFKSIPSTSFSPTSSPTTFSITITSVKPTWSQLSAKIRLQFNLPANVNFGLTYKNSKDEEIILSSQKELDDYFFQNKDFSMSFDLENNPSYKFGLIIFPLKNNAEEEENIMKGEKNEDLNYKDGQLNVEVYDDYYNDDDDYDYDDEEYVHTRDGCSQQ